MSGSLDSNRNCELGFGCEEVSKESVHVDGLRVQFRRAGRGAAVVLVHGLLGYSFSWRRVMPLLARGRKVFAPDMPGAGFSECSSNLDCRLTSAARRLLAFMDSVGISSADLVGSSYGGATAAIAAGLEPARIRSLTLISPANPWSRIGRTRLALLRNPVLARLFPSGARAARPIHRYFVRRMWGDPRRIDPETLRGYARPLVLPGIFEHSIKIVHTWDADMRELEATLPKIASIPTLLVWGSKDRLVDRTSAEAILRNFQNPKFVVMEGAGHLPYEECPEEFSRILMDFLDTVSTTKAASSMREVT